MERIDAIDDPRVAPYRGLRDRTLRGESIFVAEGRWLVERLLASTYRTLSVFASEEYAEQFRKRVPPDVPMYVAPESLLLEVVGFKFHRGILALGLRRPSLTLDALVAGCATPTAWNLAVYPEVTKPENLGLVFRSAAALGLDGIVLGERSCDPFSRRSLRVSMGAIFRVPFARSTDVLADMKRLQTQYSAELWAAVSEGCAEPLPAVQWPPRVAVLLGNESDGAAARVPVTLRQASHDSHATRHRFAQSRRSGRNLSVRDDEATNDSQEQIA